MYTGIDLSLHSTGIYNSTSQEYHLIISDYKITKKEREWIYNNSSNGYTTTPSPYGYFNSYSISDTNLKIHMYEYKGIPKEEFSKTRNVLIIDFIIGSIIPKGTPVSIETIAYSGSGIIDQLSGLNYLVRSQYYPNLNLISPSTLKKEFTGNGMATKEQMISISLVNDPTLVIIYNKLPKDFKNIKIDDLCDAYALSRIGNNL